MANFIMPIHRFFFIRTIRIGIHWGLWELKLHFPSLPFITIPIKVKAAQLEFEKEEEVHRDTEDKVRQQVKEAYLRYQEALEQIKVAEANVAQAKENARIIKKYLLQPDFYHRTAGCRYTAASDKI